MSRARSHLANFILSRLADRGESVDHFAHRAGVNGAGFARFLKGQTKTLHDATKEKVALTLGLTVPEMVSLAEGQVAYEQSPAKAAVPSRVPELVEVLHDLPPVLWGPILRASVRTGQEMARAFTLVPTSARAEDKAHDGYRDEDPVATSIEAPAARRGKIQKSQLAVA